MTKEILPALALVLVLVLSPVGSAKTITESYSTSGQTSLSYNYFYDQTYNQLEVDLSMSAGTMSLLKLDKLSLPFYVMPSLSQSQQPGYVNIRTGGYSAVLAYAYETVYDIDSSTATSNMLLSSWCCWSTQSQYYIPFSLSDSFSIDFSGIASGGTYLSDGLLFTVFVSVHDKYGMALPIYFDDRTNININSLSSSLPRSTDVVNLSNSLASPVPEPNTRYVTMLGLSFIFVYVKLRGN